MKDDRARRGPGGDNLLRRLRDPQRLLLGATVTGVHLQRVSRGAVRDPPHGGGDTAQERHVGLHVRVVILTSDRRHFFFFLQSHLFVYAASAAASAVWFYDFVGVCSVDY